MVQGWDGSQWSDVPDDGFDGSVFSDVPVKGFDGQQFVRLDTSIPDSVVNQYPFSTFGPSTWTDNVGSADMSVSGLTTDTFSNGEDSVLGDGTGDYGQSSADIIGNKETFGFAMTWQASSLSTSDNVVYHGIRETVSTGNFSYIDNNSNGGTIRLLLRDDNGNSTQVGTDNQYDDGNPHSIIINKSSDSPSDWDFYIDDMSTTVSTSILADQGFSSSDFAGSLDPAFFAANSDGTIETHANIDIGIFEINNEPYTQTEREDFVSRRPEM